MGSATFFEIVLDHHKILKQLSGAAPEVWAGFFAGLKKIHRLNAMADLVADKGLNWEPIEGRRFPGTNEQLYCFRITRGWRAVCRMQTGPVIVIDFVVHHDGAY